MHGSAYMRHLKQLHSQKQEVRWWLPRLGGGEGRSCCSMDINFSVLQRGPSPRDLLYNMVHGVTMLCCTLRLV